MELDNIGEFSIYEETNFWMYTIKDTDWDRIKKKLLLPSYKKFEIKKNDIVMVYQKSRSLKKTGIISVCQALSKMKSSDIRLSDDNSCNNFSLEPSIMSNFDIPCKIKHFAESLKNNTVEFKSEKNFKTKYVKNNTDFTKINSFLGLELLRETIKLSNELEMSNDTSDDSCSSNSSCELEEYTNSSDDDSILYVIGNIPIMMIPCKSLEWNDDPDEFDEVFKNHLLSCKKCEKTDNNNKNISSVINDANMYYHKLKNKDKIEKMLSYYLNLKNYVFELSNDDKNYTHIYVFKIIDEDSIYNNCILVVF